MEPLFADLALPLGGGVGGIPHSLTVDLDDAGIRSLQKVEAAQQRGFARTEEPMIASASPFSKVSEMSLRTLVSSKFFPMPEASSNAIMFRPPQQRK